MFHGGFRKLSVYVDAAQDRERYRAAIGILIFYGRQKLIERGERVDYTYRTDRLEKLAIERALELTKQFGRYKVIIQSDFLPAINSLNGRRNGRKRIPYFVKSVKQEAASYYRINYKYISGMENLAHRVARKALWYGSYTVYFL